MIKPVNDELRKALHDLITHFRIEDYVYDIRDNCGGDWEAEPVKRFVQCIATIKEELKK